VLVFRAKLVRRARQDKQDRQALVFKATLAKQEQQDRRVLGLKEKLERRVRQDRQA